MKIILLGYMGSGKSTIGIELATVLDTNFIDLDDYIEERENTSIPEIFDTKGEIYFRKTERDALKEILNSKDDYVLALGGGTPCYGNNIELIISTEAVECFYLKGSVPFLANRLFKEKSKRPLISNLKSLDQLQEFVGKHLFERNNYYTQTKCIIDIDNKTIKDIVEEVVCDLF